MILEHLLQSQISNIRDWEKSHNFVRVWGRELKPDFSSTPRRSQSLLRRTYLEYLRENTSSSEGPGDDRLRVIPPASLRDEGLRAWDWLPGLHAWRLTHHQSRAPAGRKHSETTCKCAWPTKMRSDARTSHNYCLLKSASQWNETIWVMTTETIVKTIPAMSGVPARSSQRQIGRAAGYRTKFAYDTLGVCSFG